MLQVDTYWRHLLYWPACPIPWNISRRKTASLTSLSAAWILYDLDWNIKVSQVTGQAAKHREQTDEGIFWAELRLVLSNFDIDVHRFHNIHNILLATSPCWEGLLQTIFFIDAFPYYCEYLHWCQNCSTLVTMLMTRGGGRVLSTKIGGW